MTISDTNSIAATAEEQGKETKHLMFPNKCHVNEWMKRNVNNPP
jgi:hypothetical protein